MYILENFLDNFEQGDDIYCCSIIIKEYRQVERLCEQNNELKENIIYTQIRLWC